MAALGTPLVDDQVGSGAVEVGFPILFRHRRRYQEPDVALLQNVIGHGGVACHAADVGTQRPRRQGIEGLELLMAERMRSAIPGIFHGRCSSHGYFSAILELLESNPHHRDSR